MNYLILVAGGRGLRMGGDVPKQFLPIGGEPVLMRTLRRFWEAFPHDPLDIILVLPADQHDYWRRLCEEFRFGVPHRIATGGEERFHSVCNGLALIPDDAEGVVAVHDGVRPFVAEEVMRRCYAVAAEAGAVVPVVPVVETVREMLEDGETGAPENPGASRTIDRRRLRLVQTPQTFRIGLLKEAYRQAYRPEFTDDASVVEALGHRVMLVEGNRENIKITTREDIDYAEYLCNLKFGD